MYTKVSESFHRSGSTVGMSQTSRVVQFVLDEDGSEQEVEIVSCQIVTAPGPDMQEVTVDEYDDVVADSSLLLEEAVDESAERIFAADTAREEELRALVAKGGFGGLPATTIELLTGAEGRRRRAVSREATRPQREALRDGRPARIAAMRIQLRGGREIIRGEREAASIRHEEHKADQRALRDQRVAKQKALVREAEKLNRGIGSEPVAVEDDPAVDDAVDVQIEE